VSGELIDPPVTALAAEVGRLLDQCPPVVAAHSERSYQFAAAFAASDGVELDDEVLYLGTVLHDIGLSPVADGSERFEVRGANLVRALLLDYGMERDRVANVWDCIAMHASTPLARHKSPETASRTAASRSTCAVRARKHSNPRWSAPCSTAGRGTTSPPSSRRYSLTKCAPIRTRFACRGPNRSPRCTWPASCRPTSSPASAPRKASSETHGFQRVGGLAPARVSRRSFVAMSGTPFDVFVRTIGTWWPV
jgi:hypothetical protein